MTIRTAVISRKDGTPDRETVEAYLPGNYKILAVLPDRVFITGTDCAGFTLDALKDRMASGLIFATEITNE